MVSLENSEENCMQTIVPGGFLMEYEKVDHSKDPCTWVGNMLTPLLNTLGICAQRFLLVAWIFYTVIVQSRAYIVIYSLYYFKDTNINYVHIW